MNWQPYPQTKPPKAGRYLVFEVFGKDAQESETSIADYTKTEGFTSDDDWVLDKCVRYWCEIVPPSASATFGAAR
jgi:hypothetical protein